ncbi:MAG: hypothetical protein ACTS2F_21515 [Thainema sp.]
MSYIMQANCYPCLVLNSLSPKGWKIQLSLLTFAIALVMSACTSAQPGQSGQSGADPQSPPNLTKADSPALASPNHAVQKYSETTRGVKVATLHPEPISITGEISFEQAVMKAANATELADVAQTVDDWERVVQHWQTAIALIQAIPATDDKYAIAQQRLPAYQQQLQVAQQQAAQLAEQQATQHKQRAKQGEHIFREVRGNYQLTNILQGTPTLQIIVLDEQWKSLSKTEQINLAEYAKSLVQSARSAPDKYVDVSVSNPIYDRFVSKAAGLCDDCWAIVVSEQPSISSFSDLKTVVQGDELWEKEDPCCRGKKVSEFVR